jgi:nucleoside-diphosphate-sugar epimerase
MNIVLTGSTGFLGKNILEFFPNIKILKKYDDITTLTYLKPDVIIHCAAEIYNKSSMFSSNVLLTHKLLEYCKENQTKFIYIGSSSEYGKTLDLMSENNVCDPQTLYAATKSCGTLLTQAYSREYCFDSVIIRPFSIYGKYEPSHRLIPRLFTVAITGETIDIINGHHDFLYIKDFLEGLQIVLQTKFDRGTIINFGTGIATSNLEVVKSISSITNKTINYKYSDLRKETDSIIWVADTLRFNTIFTPKYSLMEGLKETYDTI